MIRHRRAGRADLERVLDWAAAEGWNPGLTDAAAFQAADPEGFFLTEAEGEPVAAISVVNHGPAYAFLGLYLVRPEFRGRGIGHALWRHAIRHAGDRTIGLDAVPAQQANYAASGFVASTGTTRWVGRIASTRAAGVRPVEAVEIPALVAWEGRASGCAKPAYMAPWLRGDAARRTSVVDRDGAIAGFATIRRCRTGARSGRWWRPISRRRRS
ncbi:GNAT family N-acetyltransferase [Jannaschia ovalis]|uniref:GNAT family N-acetyltransferase n=1 Tax=Jannaschia ovalis TaxID=3038773 RepID=A0ABY8LEB4_9RHOB|nr:GNAT family N-acetyltransferase [Jannaschia sp. GRR-S6-38]WGH79501.1 GNAT family N-acetyltransferase [Jannaschia sp. GRR-S6-38]